MATFRTYLKLGRVSNWPTVWSNCFAGWLLGGGGEWPALVWLGGGATALYFSGTCLNDAFDAQWDQQRRPERPLPSGDIRLAEVWQWGLITMAVGVAALAVQGRTTTLLALALAATILVYDAIHKIFAFAPVLMAACRGLLVLAAASVGRDGITGLSVWSALVLASYVAGLGFLAQRESGASERRYWPCLLFAAPLVLACIVNRGEWFWRGALLGVALFFWTLWWLRFALAKRQRNVAYSVAGLLAGIPLVDLLAVCGGGGTAGVFLALWIAALLLQRLAPAT